MTVTEGQRGGQPNSICSRNPLTGPVKCVYRDVSDSFPILPRESSFCHTSASLSALQRVVSVFLLSAGVVSHFSNFVSSVLPISLRAKIFYVLQL